MHPLSYIYLGFKAVPIVFIFGYTVHGGDTRDLCGFPSVSVGVPFICQDSGSGVDSLKASLEGFR